MGKDLLYLYDLNYNLISILNSEEEYPANNIKRQKNINAIDTLSFEMYLASPNFIYMQNENIVRYKGQDYFIKEPEIRHDDNGKKATITCRHVSSSLEKQINQIVDLIGKSASELMNEVLNGSGWKIRTLQVDNVYRSLQNKDNTRFSNLVKIAELYDAMLFFDSATREIDLIKALPDRGIYIRYKKNMKGISLKYNSDELVTRMHVRGGDSDTGSGEISIVNVNPTHKSYIDNFSWYLSRGYAQAYINSHPEMFLHEQILSLNEYRNEQDLYDEALKRLNRACKPKMTCSISMLDFSAYPEYCGTLLDLEPQLGESVWIMDEDINVVINAKISSIEDSDDNPMDKRLGIVNEIEYSSLMQQLIDSSLKVKTAVNSLGQQRASYISGVIDLMKAKLNSTISKSYTDSQGNFIFESLDGKAALKIGGGIFGIANSKDGLGNFQWKTFGDGNGFVADMITFGVMSGGMVTWNIDNVDKDILDQSGNKLYTLPAGSLLIGNSPTDYLLYFNGTAQKLSLKNVDIDSYIKNNELSSRIQQNADSIISTVAKSIMSSSSPIVVVDDNDSTIIYSGSWLIENSPSVYGGTGHYSVNTNDYIQYTFVGTGINFYCARYSNKGLARIYIDGVDKGTVDLYYATSQLKYKVYSVTDLPYGTHTIKISVTGTKNAASSGIQVYFDYFEVLNSTAIDTSNFITQINQNYNGITSLVKSGDFATYKDQTAQSISAKLSTDSLSTEIQARVGDVQIAFNNINPNVQNKSGKFSVYNGNFELFNSSSQKVAYVDTSGLMSSDRGLAVYAGKGGVHYTGQTIYTMPNNVPLYILCDNDVHIKSSTVGGQANTWESIYCDIVHIAGRETLSGGYRQGYIRSSDSNGMNGLCLYDQFRGDRIDIRAKTGDFTSLSVSGSKNCVVDTRNYGRRSINAYETADYYFGDIGSGRLLNGECIVWIDEIFKECISTDTVYQVFISKYGEGDVWISERNKDYFIVKGTKDIEFGWELKAKRIGYENDRLEVADVIKDIDPLEIYDDVDFQLNSQVYKEEQYVTDLIRNFEESMVI